MSPRQPETFVNLFEEEEEEEVVGTTFNVINHELDQEEEEEVSEVNREAELRRQEYIYDAMNGTLNFNGLEGRYYVTADTPNVLIGGPLNLNINLDLVIERNPTVSYVLPRCSEYLEDLMEEFTEQFEHMRTVIDECDCEKDDHSHCNVIEIKEYIENEMPEGPSLLDSDDYMFLYHYAVEEVGCDDAIMLFVRMYREAE